MFPHDITIYRYIDKLDTYSTTYLNGVYVEQTLNGLVESNGEQNSGEIIIVTNAENAHRYESKHWRVLPGDIIVRGRGSAISSLTELDEFYKVTTVAENLCNSDVDNITIKAV